MRTARIAELQAMLSSRTERDGSAKPGYKRNVGLIRAELARLKGQDDGQP